MRDEIIDIKELTDSREVMMKKSPPAITAFISIVAVILVVALVWSCFGKIDTYVTSTGEVRTQAPASTITLTNGGKIKKVLFEDGANVKKGDTVFEFDSEYYEEQKSIISNQISDKQVDIDNYNRLIKSIKDDKNVFDKNTEAEFYYQYENYRLELDATVNQISTNNEQVSSSKSELEQNISQTESNLQDTEDLYNEFTKLYDAIDNDTKYKGNHNLVLNTYNTYVSSRSKAQASYDSYVLAYDNLTQRQKEEPDSVTNEQIMQAEYSKNSALADLNSVKISTLSEISSQLLELGQQINTYKANIESYNLKIDALSTDNTKETSIEKIKNSYYSSINNTIKTLYSEIDSLNTQILEIDEAVSNLSLKAEQDGVLIYAHDLAIGDTISSGTTMASIVPNTNDYTVVIYIPENNVFAIKVGQKIEYTFTSISATDFGKVYGEILTISKDSFSNQSDGQKYYKATASIEKTELSNKEGEKRNIKVGMLAEVHIITGTQSIMTWLLDKLNFL